MRDMIAEEFPHVHQGLGFVLLNLKQPQRLWDMRAQSDGWAERLMQAAVRKLIAPW